MTLQASGAISLGNVNTEVGANSATETRSLGDTVTRTLFGDSSGAISLSQGYSRTHIPDFEISPSVNGRSTWTISVNGALNLGSHGQWSLTPRRNFTASVKMWGAGGARGYGYNQVPLGNYSQTNGGGGGYTSGSMTFYTNQTIYYLRVGEGGQRVTSASGQRADYRAGGITATYGYGGTEGGGYSAIFGAGAFYHGDTYVRFMAGGGGGGGDSRYGGGGGAGGGSSGEVSDAAYPQGGGGGSQSGGGYAAQYNGAGAGSALTGGWASSTTHPGLGAGGGGYYGGGGGNVGGGGGGSGYVGSSTWGVISGTTTTGVSATPANSSDSQRGGAGDGGSSSQGSNGADGRIIIS
jgi:hypothetical protein